MSVGDIMKMDSIVENMSPENRAIFQAELLSEKTEYDIQKSINNVCQKLINRHPHIFETKKNKNCDKGNWELTKQKEKNRESILDGVPIAFPGLLRSRRIQEKAASVGFDWDKKERVLEKLDEEIEELKDAIDKNEGIEDMPIKKSIIREDGTTEILDLDKLRIIITECCEGIPDVSVDVVYDTIDKNIYDGIKKEDLMPVKKEGVDLENQP